jgi:hypothetical protein
MVAPFKFDHTHSETKAATPALPSVDGDDWCQPTLLFLWSRLLFFLLLQIVLGTKQSIMRFGKRSIPYTKQHANTTTNGFALAPSHSSTNIDGMHFLNPPWPSNVDKSVSTDSFWQHTISLCALATWAQAFLEIMQCATTFVTRPS